MSPLEDQIDSGGRITDLVFDDNNHEIQSWRFCNSRSPRSKVACFTHFKLFLTAVSLIKLVFSNLDCEDSTFWFSLLSCTVRYALPNPKLL